MIPRTCKRLIEVDFPIAEVSKHSAREKNIRHGHPSTLHLWWARRPLAACRAVLMGLLLPDPCDKDCPPGFKTAARAALAPVPNVGLAPEDDGLRAALLTFIGDFADWDMSSNPVYLRAARELVRAAHGEEPPLVVDPFAGGGSIPLEALRLGCDAFASDLNPVACLIQKVLLEDIPRHGPELADELRKAGEEIKKKAEEDLRAFYPEDPDGSRPIAYIWARTVRCESPNCGCEIPLARSFWLSKKPSRKRALKYHVVRGANSTYVDFEVFAPRADAEVPKGTISQANATCPACGIVLPSARVREQLALNCGGADVVFDDDGNRIGGARLLAVVTTAPGRSGRAYRIPASADYSAVWRAAQSLAVCSSVPPPEGKSLIPDEPLPSPGGTYGSSGLTYKFNPLPLYGLASWGDLFTARQKLALLTVGRIVRGSSDESMREALMVAVGKMADYGSSGAKWHLTFEKVTCTFGRQALSMTWDFVEALPFGDASGSMGAALATADAVIRGVCKSVLHKGEASLQDACQSPLPDGSVHAWFTDPPYYDAIPYSDLSDFFFVWLKRALPGHPLLEDPFDSSNPLTPKAQEVIETLDLLRGMRKSEAVTAGVPVKTREFFESKMARAFAEGRRVLTDDGVGCVVFAHKTTEGWEALLTGMVGAGWVITGSWPVATERPGRLRSQDSAALATSVHLICRPRPDDAPIGDWGEILRELPNRIGDWMERLSREGVRGADIVFACIGPALELYSRHPRVETPEGRTVDLAEFLEKVWEVVGRSALEQVLGTAEAQARNGGAGALEEDSRLTALFLWTIQATNGGNGQNGSPGQPHDVETEDADDAEESGGTGKKKGGFGLLYDVVRRFAQPLGIHLENWDGRVIEMEKGIVRLLSVAERARVLFGEEGASTMASHIEAAVKGPQAAFDFEELRAEAPSIRAGARASRGGGQVRGESTTLDRVHAAMILQRAGRAAALHALIEQEMDRGPDFLRLANALSALYPKDSEEKRLVDAMLLGVRR
jgi:putative DNA methylase